MSKLDEIRSRPATLVFTSRIDSRHLATILNFWHSRAERPASISELVRLSLESFSDSLTRMGTVEFIESHSVADEVIRASGLATKKQDSMNRKTRRDIELDLGAFEGRSPEKLATLGRNPSKPSTPDLAYALRELESNMADDLNSRVADAQNRTKDFKHAMGVPIDPTEEVPSE